MIGERRLAQTRVPLQRPDDSAVGRIELKYFIHELHITRNIHFIESESRRNLPLTFAPEMG